MNQSTRSLYFQLRFVAPGLVMLLGLGLAFGAAKTGGAPGGLDPDDLISMRELMAAARYQLSWQVRDGEWAWRAPNPAQGFEIAFSTSGFQARNATAGEGRDWTFSLALCDCNSETLPAAPEELTARRAEVTYRWSDTLREWYRNTPAGVAHGLTLAAPPPGGENLLELGFELETSLAPVLETGRRGVSLRDWHGRERLRYDRLAVSDAAGRFVPAWLELDGERTLRLVVDTVTAAWPLTVDILLHLPVAVLHASDMQATDWFGYCVAISGDTIVVGAELEDGGPGDPADMAGAAYLFTRNQGGAGGWGEVKILRASDAQAGDNFGCAVAIDGDTIAVGAYSEEGGPGDPVFRAGAVYVFDRNQGGAGNWGEVKILHASDMQLADLFGCAVAISGDTVVVGAWGENGGAGDPVAEAGAAYVFARNRGGADNWGEVKILHASDMQFDDRFGHAVAIDGDTAVVGAWNENGGPGDPVSWAGATYVFARNHGGADNWGEVKILRSSNMGLQDHFGGAVAISGDTVAVGSPFDDGPPVNPVQGAGAVYVFARNQGGAGNWGETRVLYAHEMQFFDYFGWSVAIDGDTIVAGKVYADEDGAGLLDNSGAAYVFARNQGGAGNWGEVQVLRASDPGSMDWFGGAVAISGDTVVIGAYQEDGGAGDPLADAGAAFVYSRNDGVWQEAAIRRASDLQPMDQLGYSVAVDGGALVVGAPGEDGGAGDPLAEAGAAYVFYRNLGGTENWGEARILRASDAQAQDWFGNSVAVSGDTVIVGAYLEDGGAGDPVSDSGAAYVFGRNQGGADNWGQVQVLRKGDPKIDDYFGCSVAISGDTAVVGAYMEYSYIGPPDDYTGSASIFGRNQGGPDHWGEVRVLRSSEMFPGDRFGHAVAISGELVVVGAPREDGGPGHPAFETGTAYVFERNRGGADNWGEVKILRASDQQAFDEFGYAVAISADTVLVGAPFEDGGPGDPAGQSGAVYMFERNLGGADHWGEARILRASDRQAGDAFGASVAIDGVSILVGAPVEDGGPGDPAVDAGAAYFFARNHGGPDNWGEVQILAPGERFDHDWFGLSVDIDRDTVVAGAAANHDEVSGAFDAGAVYLYHRLPCALVRCTAEPRHVEDFVPAEVHFSATAVYLGECDTPLWEWDFGDGTTSTEQNPVHTYPDGGYYFWNCRVTVGDFYFEKQGAIFACDFDLQATATPAEGTEPQEVLFASEVATAGCGGPVTYLWEFGDGETSPAAAPVHVYAAGDWTWTLTASTYAFQRQVSGTVQVRSYGLHYLDDQGRSRLCVNPKSGAFNWQVLSGPAAGDYPGVCQISTQGGLINYTTARGLPYELRFRYQPSTGHADGVFTLPGIGLQSGLDDRNAADNPPGCD